MSTHFSEASLRFLRGLHRHNDRDWFNERKATYEAEIKEPMLALIASVNEAMLRFAPEHVRAPAKTMMRIYRDVRFSKDKRPYKPQIAAWWARAGLEKTSGGGFYLHVAHNEVHLGCGVFMPEREQLLAIRRHIVLHHARLHQALTSRTLATLGFSQMEGRPLSRPPKGFTGLEIPATAAELLRRQDWGVTAAFPAAMALEPTFTREVVRRFERAAPLVALLNEPLLPKPRQPLF